MQNFKESKASKRTKFISIEEQLENCLGTVGQSQSYFVSRKEYLCSVFIISQHFNKVLDAILALEGDFLQYPSGVF